MGAVMSPDALSYGYVETVEAMTSGTVFSNITWPAAGKNANDPETSSTVGKWGYATVPGYVVDGQVHQRSMSAPGYTILVSNHADVNKEAAYLYTQWFTSPENLIQANQNLGGNTDVVRASIFADPSMAEIFPGAGEYLDAQKANLAQAVPDPVMPGYGEYAQALEIELANALTGQKSPQEALDDAAEAWDGITDSYGREEQLQVGRTSWLRSPAGPSKRKPCPKRRRLRSRTPGPAGSGGRRPRPAAEPSRPQRWLFVAPAVLLLLGLTAYPFGYAVYISLHTWKVTRPVRPFIGFDNFRELLFDDERFINSVEQTLIIASSALVLEFLFGLVMALLFWTAYQRVRWVATGILVPMMIAPVVVGFTARMAFNNSFGFLNQILSLLWPGDVNLQWLSDPSLAPVVIILADAWQWGPFMFLILLAGLLATEGDQLEAAVCMEPGVPARGTWCCRP